MAVSRNDRMMRIIINLSVVQLQALDIYRKPLGISRSEAIRRAVAAQIPADPIRKRDFSAVFGAWKGRGLDGLEYEHRLRKEWSGRAIRTNAKTRLP